MHVDVCLYVVEPSGFRVLGFFRCPRRCLSINKHPPPNHNKGIASNECDNGNIQPGTAILAFQEMKPFFPYVRSMLSASSINRFVDHKGKTRIIHGTTGLQQGDPLSMLTYSAAVHPIWLRVMAHSPTTHGVGIADDAFLEDDLPRVLRTLADAMKSFRTDADLEMQPTNLKIHIKGVSLERARELIQACIANDASLASLRLLLDSDCIQVDGLRVARVPVGSPELIANYVRSKALDIVQDIAKLNIMEADPLVHYHLVKTCQHTRLAFLLRNLSPAQMTRPASGIVGPQHVDRAALSHRQFCKLAQQANSPRGRLTYNNGANV